MNTAICNYKLVVVAYQICMTILILLHCTYLIAAPDYLTLVIEFESVQNHHNSSDVHHKESL